MIRGQFVGNWPYIGGLVSLPRLGLGPTPLPFVLDTGADQCMIHPLGSSLLGIKFSTDFKGIPLHKIPGVGTADAWLEDFVIDLPHTDGRVDSLKGKVLIAKPSPTNQKHPNLLGRDVFDNYAIVYHRSANRVELHP